MTATSAPGGLIGAASRSAGFAKRLLSRTDGIALLLVLFAGVITIIKKNATPDFWSYAMWFGITLGIAALLYEMMSAKRMARAFHQGKAGALAAAFFIWLCAFGFSVSQWLGAASENQTEKSNIHQAAYVKTISTQETRAAAKKELDRLQNRMAWMDTAVNGRPVRTAEAAEADIRNAQANRFWGTTQGCTATKGPKTRAFCDAYAAAVSEKALAIEKSTLAEELKTAREAYTAADVTARETPMQTSQERADLLLFTKWFGFSEADAGAVNGLLAIIAISIFLSFGAMQTEWERLSAIGPRQRFNVFQKILRSFNKLVFGKEPGHSMVIEKVYHDRKAAAGMLNGISAAEQQMMRA